LLAARENRPRGLTISGEQTQIFPGGTWICCSFAGPALTRTQTLLVRHPPTCTVAADFAPAYRVATRL